MESAAGEAGLLVAAPEVGIPLEISKQLAPHVGTLLMIPLVVLSVLLVIVGIIVLSAAKSKAPGALLLVLGFLLAGGALFVMVRTERGAGRKAREAERR